MSNYLSHLLRHILHLDCIANAHFPSHAQTTHAFHPFRRLVWFWFSCLVVLWQTPRLRSRLSALVFTFFFFFFLNDSFLLTVGRVLLKIQWQDSWHCYAVSAQFWYQHLHIIPLMLQKESSFAIPNVPISAAATVRRLRAFVIAMASFAHNQVTKSTTSICLCHNYTFSCGSYCYMHF